MAHTFTGSPNQFILTKDPSTHNWNHTKYVEHIVADFKTSLLKRYLYQGKRTRYTARQERAIAQRLRRQARINHLKRNIVQFKRELTGKW